MPGNTFIETKRYVKNNCRQESKMQRQHIATYSVELYTDHLGSWTRPLDLGYGL
jgi:hypothetical protein